MNKLLRNFAVILSFSVIAASCYKKPGSSTSVTGDPNTNPSNPNNPTTNEVHFQFENYFGDLELLMNAGEYTTAQNEKVTITTFNYWITNIKLVKNDGSEFIENESYRLLRGDQHGTLHFHLKDVPAGTYTAVKFMIGVDLERNTSGAQTGALDPGTNPDMFWTWNTGYIQAKLEGTSPQSTAPNHTFEYHIGGVAAGMETPRSVTLGFPQTLEVGAKAGSLIIKADIAKWFPTPKTIAEVSSVTMPGQAAVKIADNYAKMFSLTSVGNE